MKYLVIARRRHVPLPVDTLEPTRLWIQDRVADHDLDCCYGMPSGGISIANANSRDELTDMLRDYPEAEYVDFEIHPLCDIDTVFTEAELLAERRAGA
jgi:hypothetical protein